MKATWLNVISSIIYLLNQILGESLLRTSSNPEFRILTLEAYISQDVDHILSCLLPVSFQANLLHMSDAKAVFLTKSFPVFNLFCVVKLLQRAASVQH